MQNIIPIVNYLARTSLWVIPILLIDLSVYWILWDMFLVIYHTTNMQCSIFLQKLPEAPFKKLTRFSSVWNQKFPDLPQRIFY